MKRRHISIKEELGERQFTCDQVVSMTSGMSASDSAPSPLVEDLASALADAGVEYCHWKSNASIALAEAGETDLDLLVAESDAEAFNGVLDDLHFVAANKPHLAEVPGVAHLFSHDPAADRFVHLHAHYRLVLGHDRTKNYRLPIEEPYLASASTARVLPTPSPDFEYVVLVIRMALKYAVVDEIIWSALRGDTAGPSGSEREELGQLAAEIDDGRIRAIVAEHLPFVGEDLFSEAQRFLNGGLPTLRRVRLAHSLHNALRSYGRRAPLVDGWLRVWRRLSLSLRRRVGGMPRFRLANRGGIVAVMGGDGSGKTTALSTVNSWLSRDFDVLSVHLGKPPWSWTTYIVRGLLKVAGVFRLGRRPVGASRVETSDDSGTEYRRFVWFACKARDRLRAYHKAQRAADRGIIVLSDRFPHPALPRTDVPQIGRLVGAGRQSRLTRELIRIENHYHDAIGLPDLTIVLKVDPEESARRKAEEPYQYVLERATEIWDIDWSGYDVHVVDASRSPEAVAADIKQVVWEGLSRRPGR